MEFDPIIGYFTRRIYDLRQDHNYRWKVTINGTWNRNYGAHGRNSRDASFFTNNFGAVRLIFIPHTINPVLCYDYCVIDWCRNPDIRFKSNTYPIE
jgi:hypothetical protein